MLLQGIMGKKSTRGFLNKVRSNHEYPLMDEAREEIFSEE